MLPLLGYDPNFKPAEALDSGNTCICLLFFMTNVSRLQSVPCPIQYLSNIASCRSGQEGTSDKKGFPLRTVPEHP